MQERRDTAAVRPVAAAPGRVAPLVWMAACAALSWLGLTAVLRGGNPGLLLGMIGPLASAGISWLMIARAQASAPERVTAVMTVMLAAKMVFFAIYVVAVLKLLAQRPTLFVGSFTAYFVALYAMQAVFLRRLFEDGTRAAAR